MTVLVNRGMGWTVQWEEAKDLFPCPPIMWQGIWREAGEKYGQSWDIWTAVLAAIGASVQRRLCWDYVRAPIYGMTYALIVSPTGTGKELCTNMVDALLPPDYNIRDAVQSGPALFPIMANAGGKNNKNREARPTILIMSEWTKLAKNAQIQHSSIVDDLNTLFHRQRNWNVSRSERDFAGGDKWLTNPALSVFGTTTPEKLRNTVTEEMMNDGFLNRYLILPGPTAPFEFWPKRKMAGDPKRNLTALQVKLVELAKGEEWGKGANYQEAFTPAASARIQEWGAPYFEPLMRSNAMGSNRKKRLHMYAHLISMLSAWSDGRRMVELGDVEMAIYAVNTSSIFTDWLFDDAPIQLSQRELGDAQVEDLVYRAIIKRPNYYTDRRLYDNFKTRGLNVAKVKRATMSLKEIRKIHTHPETWCYISGDALAEVLERGSFLVEQ